MTKAAKENHEPAATVQRGDGEDVHTSEGDGDDGGKESDHGEAGGEEIWEVATDDADDAGDGVGYVLELFFAFLADGFVGGDLTGGAGGEVDDELAEAFVLAQTKRIRPFPIILYDSNYWRGLVDWLKNSMVQGGYIGLSEIEPLITLCDTPEEVHECIKRRIIL